MRSRAGSTLVEAMISLAIVLVILGGALVATEQGTAAYEQQLTENAVQTRTGRGLDRILRELAGSSLGSLNPPDPGAPLGTDALSYQRATGWVGGSIVWSPIERVAFEIEESELDNGVDDDGDGFVDEGVVVHLENPGQIDERRSALVRGVCRYLEGEEPNGLDDNANGLLDESGLSFERVAGVLIVRLSIEGMGPEHTRVVETVESSIRMRNRPWNTETQRVRTRKRQSRTNRNRQ